MNKCIKVTKQIFEGLLPLFLNEFQPVNLNAVKKLSFKPVILSFTIILHSK